MKKLRVKEVKRFAQNPIVVSSFNYTVSRNIYSDNGKSHLYPRKFLKFGILYGFHYHLSNFLGGGY